MKVVIVGAGEVGSTIARSLAGSHDIIVIDVDPERVDALTYELDVLALMGDGTDAETLREAGVPSADLFIASTDRDETNLVACGTANALGSPFTIARVKRLQFFDTWREHDTAFGVDFMVSTDLLTARAIVDVIGLPTARAVDTFADGAVQMAEFEIPADSPIADLSVAEADRFETLTFAAIIRDGEVGLPTGQTAIKAADDVVVIGTPESIRRFAADIAPKQDTPTEVVIAGGSAIGFQTARLLEEQGFRPRLIERDSDRAQGLAEKLQNTVVLQSDATDLDFLEREHVGRADVFIAALDNDQQNLLATLLAHRLGANRTVAVVDTVAFSDLFEAVGVDVAVSPREATAEEITRFTRSRRAENVAIIEQDRAEVLEFEVDAESPAANRQIRDIAGDLPGGVVVGALTRNNDFVTPRGDTVIQPGDHVVVFTEADTVEAVLEMF
ncbi:Trk system potassium transporter TrkA [Haloarculaceae archaeon H-GB2-1]|nr:Trk system potassium transporter TrkA [Haloarculaceae archaeon H-GB1-1]MEA5389313.1 Trk system potassium transporter TrkA [Haloarculaceae archaeon H-GB11]MEA5409892.1 Trk system potassium transporter TrkA [Haloarculaceae archaeon H-GB2-1]